MSINEKSEVKTLRKSKEEALESTVYYKPEPFPLDVEELSLEAKTKSGLNVKIVSQTNAELRRFDKVKNPNLICLLDFHCGKIYMKKDDGSLWLFTFNEKCMVWVKLYDYIVEGFMALCILQNRGFNRSIPKWVWVKKNVKLKMLKMLKVLENERLLQKNVLEDYVSQKSHKKNVVLPNLISKTQGSREVASNG